MLVKVKMKKVTKKLLGGFLAVTATFTTAALTLNANAAEEDGESNAPTTSTLANPIAKYEFKDATNPGKDTMGNYDLVLKDSDVTEKGTGTVSVEDGVATFNGSAGLIPASNDNDITENLSSFTLTFDVSTTGTNGNWASPVAFGWNDWSPTKWATFQFSGNSDLLRFTTASALESNKSNVDQNANAFWGKEIGKIGVDTFHNVMLSVDLNSKINVYLDGVLKYSYDTPADYSLKDADMRFALGGNSCWGNVYNPFVGSLKNVTIYDFAYSDEATIAPIAKYDFSDSTNPGKDTMGNYDLVLKDSDGTAKGTGTVSVENGVATFNGSAGLIPASNDNDITESLGSFTLAFDVSTTGTNGDWVSPVGFGWNDWNATKWGLFQFSGKSDLLRFTTASAKSDFDGKSNVDHNSSNGYWGTEIGNLGTDTFHNVILSVDLDGKINVYLDGVLTKYSFDTPENFDLKDSNMRFAIGGVCCWGNIYQAFIGSLKNVAIYDFAFNDSQASAFNTSKTATVSGVESLELASKPSKLSYFVGEELDLTGLAVKAVVGNTKTTILVDSVNGFDSTTAGTQTLTYVVGLQQISFDVEVVAVVDESVSVKTNLTKTSYFVGDLLDVSGLTLEVAKNNGEQYDVTVTAEMVTGFDSTTAGEQTLTITYNDLTTSVKVTVVAITVDSIAVKTEPTKTTYKKGEELDLTGLKIEATKNNGSKEEITVTTDMVTGFDSTTIGEQTLTITYNGKTTTFTVTVEKKSGCGGSVAASIMGVIVLFAAVLVLRKKREE